MPQSSQVSFVRRYPIGAEVVAGGGVHFRVWAPLRHQVEVQLSASTQALVAESDGYFSGLVAGAAPGMDYRFRLDGGDSFPDPASRYQPEGPHGPSRIVDPRAFAWTDAPWQGRKLSGSVIYELHIGTFTQEGTWRGAMAQLPQLAELGISVIEVMPVADFSGRFGWGYDGVNLFAPMHGYGTPDDLRRFVDRAHALGLAVILDVVYNHFGPDGNYLGQYSNAYFTTRHQTDWGDAINYDGPDSGPVREHVISNAAYWIDEYHLDGLRLDATQNIYDSSPRHILAEITAAVRTAAGGRHTIVVAENESQEARLIHPVEQGGMGMDGVWNDDFHHSSAVALSGRHDAYYTDYRGSAQEFVSALKYGYLYQGQWYKWQAQRRGSPTLGLPRSAFIDFIQNHDQVANSFKGLRSHQLTSPALHRAMTALFLLGTATPMLFQGQEFSASTPFLFFADQPHALAEVISKGRGEFLAQWRSLRLPEVQERLPDPTSVQTFERCKLDHGERERNPEAYALHRDLIALRHNDPVFQQAGEIDSDGAVLSQHALVYRYFGGRHGDRLLLVNLGRDLDWLPAPEPLLAPPAGCRWTLMFSTEHPNYGGDGTPDPESDQGFRVPAQAAVILRAIAQEEPRA